MNCVNIRMHGAMTKKKHKYLSISGEKSSDKTGKTYDMCTHGKDMQNGTLVMTAACMHDVKSH